MSKWRCWWQQKWTNAQSVWKHKNKNKYKNIESKRAQMPVWTASEHFQCQYPVNIFSYKAHVMLTITQRHTQTHIFVHMLGLTVNRLLSWPFCLPFFSFLALPVWGVEVGGLVFLAERGAWTSATGLTSSCSASCTKWGCAGGANEEQEGRRYTKQKDKEKG